MIRTRERLFSNLKKAGISKQSVCQIFRGKIDEKSEQVDICTIPFEKKTSFKVIIIGGAMEYGGLPSDKIYSFSRSTMSEFVYLGIDSSITGHVCKF